MALSNAGAQSISRPRLRRVRKGGGLRRQSARWAWGCSPCFEGPRYARVAARRGGSTAETVEGEPRCQNCPDTAGDPLGELVELITGAGSGARQGRRPRGAESATVRPAGQRRLAWAVRCPTRSADRRGLRSPGSGGAAVHRRTCRRRSHEGRPPGLPTLRRGEGACRKLLDGKRICRNCFAHHAAVPCAGCGAVREPAARDAEGRPLCPNCLIREPANLEECRECRKRKPVAVRLPDGPRCNNCRPQDRR